MKQSSFKIIRQRCDRRSLFGCSFLPFLLLALLISPKTTALAPMDSEEASSSSPPSSCVPITSADVAYKYKQLVLEYITNVDDIILHKDDSIEWYDNYVQPMQSNGIIWTINA